MHAQKSGANLGDASREIKELCNALDTCGILEKVASANKHQNEKEKDRINDPSAKFPSYLLPMAFPEGSPMHPSYGAGHGTVAGACTSKYLIPGRGNTISLVGPSYFFPIFVQIPTRVAKYQIWST